MRSTPGLASSVLIGSAVLVGLTGGVVLLTMITLSPPPDDLALLTTFLLLSGGVTLLLGLVVSRTGLPGLFGTHRAKLILTSAFTAFLVLVNVGFTPVLMFLSPHDLALLAGLLGFAVGISIFVAFSLSEPMTRSFQEVVQAVARISVGALNTRVPVDSQDEIGVLAREFNSMATRLEASFARERELEEAR